MSWHIHALQQPPWLRVSDDLGGQNARWHTSYCKADMHVYYWALVVTFNFKEYDLGGRMSSSLASVAKTSLKYM